MKIYKYMLYNGMINVPLPNGSTPIHVGIQNNEVAIWAETPDEPEPHMPAVTVFFVLTGETTTRRGIYLGTVQLMLSMVFGDQPYVQHFYYSVGDQ